MKKITKIIILLLILTIPSKKTFANEKIKIGLLIPLSGHYSTIGQSIIKATKLAVDKIDSPLIEILPRDTESDPATTLRRAKELSQLGVKIIIGPVFSDSLIYLDELKDITFLSLTNKDTYSSKKIISAGINATSQLKAIQKFIELNKIKNTIFLTPNANYKYEIEKAISVSKLKIKKNYIYDLDPTKLTKQIETITNYKRRKQNLEDEINRLEKSDKSNKKRLIENLKKRDTLGNVKFDSVIIADFDESLKSVTTSLLYTDVSPRNKYFITLNQWFDKSLLNEVDIQPLYFPSINKNNFENYKDKFFKEFNEYPSHLSLLSYDLVGLIYYLALKNDFSDFNKLFKIKNSFKGKIGIFDIKNNRINHRLNFYKIDNKRLIEIF